MVAMDRYRRWLAVTVLASTTLSAVCGGCRLCHDCHPTDYPAYGGAWERTRRDGGRVASVFDPAGARAAELADRSEPPTPDVWERQRARDDQQPDVRPEEWPDVDPGPRTREQIEAERRRRQLELEGLRIEDIRER